MRQHSFFSTRTTTTRSSSSGDHHSNFYSTMKMTRSNSISEGVGGWSSTRPTTKKALKWKSKKNEGWKGGGRGGAKTVTKKMERVNVRLLWQPCFRKQEIQKKKKRGLLFFLIWRTPGVSSLNDACASPSTFFFSQPPVVLVFVVVVVVSVLR